MASKMSQVIGFLLLIGCVMQISATDYTVGDTSGWATGVDYSTWTSGKTFAAGDTLTFNYASGAHTVAEVSKSDYSSCSSSNALSSDSSGTTTVTLKTAGDHYYICGVPGHCSGGMKLSVNVGSASSTTPTSPSTTPASPSTPSTTPTTPSTTPNTVTPTAPATTGVSSAAGMGGLRGNELVVLGVGGLVGFALGLF
ncbi:hypothetical protein LUZ60_001216 [Juncus effusus]|nr:hypothetical protein LUZ60_001216 [Juncus effusus]